MQQLRYLLVERLYQWSKLPYRLLFKKEVAWHLSVKELLRFHPETLGYHLGCFLLKYNFTPEPQLEDHDVFHVLTHTGISVPEEIAMQFYLFGNGKRSAYLFTVLFLGVLLFPDKISLFQVAYTKGKTAHPFYDLDFLKLLTQPLIHLQESFKIDCL